jgi:hypothetical protein
MMIHVYFNMDHELRTCYLALGLNKTACFNVDMPKLFVVQACRGNGIQQAYGQDSVDGGTPLKDEYFNFHVKSPVDGDIIICHACTESKF